MPGTLLSDCTGQPVNVDIFRHLCRKLQKDKCAQDQQLLQSVSPPKDEYLEEAQSRQMLVIEDDSSLLAPSSINEPERKETLVPTERPESTAEVTSVGDTLVSQVTPLLGITPSKNTQLQTSNMPEDIADILGTRAFHGHTIADIGWHNCEPAKMFLTTH